MYALDSKVCALADQLIKTGEAQQLPPTYRTWIFMPFMHSELVENQEVRTPLTEAQHTSGLCRCTCK